MPQRKFYRRLLLGSDKSPFVARLFFVFLRLFVLGLAAIVVAFLLVFIFYAKDLPRPEKFTERSLSQSTKIFDRTGEILLYEIYGEERRTLVPFETIPASLKQAVIATEDNNFYHHFGIDPKGIARSILADLKIGSPVFGGSTIPQQLIRSTFLSNEKTASRKIKEIVLALELNRRYSKDQILGWYLNQVPFGLNSYGAEAASQTYFKKSVSEISLSEAATLAALIQAPSRLSKKINREDLLKRKNYVLDQMANNGFFSRELAEQTKKEEIKFAEIKISIKAPHFTLWVKDYLEEKYGENFLKEKGLKVYTSLNMDYQQLAEKIVEEKAKTNKDSNAYNAALVAIAPKTGEVLAMVGSADYFGKSYPENCTPGVDCLFNPEFNVAVENPGRQPGSAFKPFVYATVFEKGFNSSTTVIDEETNFGVWGGKEYTPQNYDGRFRGAVTLKESLAQSLNVPSIKILYLAGSENSETNPLSTTMNNFTGQEEIFSEGLKNSIKTAKEMGITTLNNPPSFYGPSIVLGGGEVKLLDITSAYGVFANEGLNKPSTAILKIEDQNGNIIEENKKTPKRVLEKETCRVINDILSDNDARTPIFGPRSSLYFENYQVAVKTGTTQTYRDAWTIGYSPSIVVGVWVGNNDNSPIDKKSGAMIAAPIWHQFMEEILIKLPKENFTKPETSIIIYP